MESKKKVIARSWGIITLITIIFVAAIPAIQWWIILIPLTLYIGLDPLWQWWLKRSENQ